MKRLLIKKAELNISKVVDNNILNQLSIKYIMQLKKFPDYVKNENINVIQRILKLKLINLSKFVLKDLLSIDEIKAEIEIEDSKSLIESIIRYIKADLRNKGQIYTELTKYINEQRNKEKPVNREEKLTDREEPADKEERPADKKETRKELKTVDDVKQYLKQKKNFTLEQKIKDIVENSLYPFITYDEEDTDYIGKKIKEKFLEEYPSGEITKDQLYYFLRKLIAPLFQIYLRMPIIPIIKELYAGINDDKSVKCDNIPSLKLQIVRQLNFIKQHFTNSVMSLYSNNKHYLKHLGIKVVMSPGQKKKQLSNLTFKEVQKLPKLTDMKDQNDSIDQNANILFSNVYDSNIMLIVSSDNKIIERTVNSYKEDIAKLVKENLGYAVGPVTNNGIVCITDHQNIDLTQAARTLKEDKDRHINKVYVLDEQANFAANIIRKAKLYKKLI